MCLYVDIHLTVDFKWLNVMIYGKDPIFFWATYVTCHEYINQMAMSCKTDNKQYRMFSMCAIY